MAETVPLEGVLPHAKDAKDAKIKLEQVSDASQISTTVPRPAGNPASFATFAALA